MNLLDWVKREVEIACKRDEGEDSSECPEYGRSCCQSALKAMESLCEDGHSGASIVQTMSILNRLVEGKCLTPIEDVPEVWSDCHESEEFVQKFGYNQQQCNRMTGLFKETYNDGRIEYKDVHQSLCIGMDRGYGYHSNLVKSKVAEKYPELFKIEMPYFPHSTPIKIYTEDFLTDEKNGDYDTVGILYFITPNEGKFEVNRFFKSDGNEEWVELTEEEYQARKLLKL